MKGLATSCRALAFRARNAGAPTFALLAVLALAVVLVGPAQGEPASGTTARAPRTDVKNPLKEAQARFNERRKAAGRAAAKGLTQPTAEAAQLATPGEAPHYFSVPNYANSPLPEIAGAVISVGNPLIARTYATDFPVAVGEPAPVFVVVPKPLPDGLVQGFQTFNQATAGASPFPSAGNVFHAYVLRPTANPNEYRVVYDSGLFTVPALADPGTGAV